MFIPTTALFAMAAGTPVIIGVIAVALLLLFFLASYVKAPPNRASSRDWISSLWT